MNVLYSDQPIPIDIGVHSIFLAGPTPRDMVTPSWRPEAILILKILKYTGTVFVPEHKVRKENMDYTTQTEWEDEGLIRCTKIIFWVPRNLKTMPAFTTNVEFGRFAHLPKSLYGRPDNAPKNRYLDWYYGKYNKHNPIYKDLISLLTNATP